MIRGVSFELSQTIKALGQILKRVDVEKYCWHNIIIQNEVWENHNGGISLQADYYDGKSFLQNITSEHFIIFLKLQAYFENGKYFDIHTYDDFLKSDCQLLLLIWDCKYVNIYAKDINVSKVIYENALSNNYMDVEYITENNDGRTKMDVL